MSYDKEDGDAESILKTFHITTKERMVARAERTERQRRARKGVDVNGRSIKHLGVIVRRQDVRRHRYLAAHGMQHSSIANLYLGR
jgi:hypothetical protein